MRSIWLVVALMLFASGCEKLNRERDRLPSEAHMAVTCAWFTFGSSVGPAPPVGPVVGEKCDNCKGTGKVGDGRVFVPCDVCGGDGKIDEDDVHSHGDHAEPAVAEESPVVEEESVTVEDEPKPVEPAAIHADILKENLENDPKSKGEADSAVKAAGWPPKTESSPLVEQSPEPEPAKAEAEAKKEGMQPVDPVPPEIANSRVEVQFYKPRDMGCEPCDRWEEREHVVFRSNGVLVRTFKTPSIEGVSYPLFRIFLDGKFVCDHTGYLSYGELEKIIHQP